MTDPLPILDYHGRSRQPEISPQYEMTVARSGEEVSVTAKPAGVPAATGCAVGFLMLFAAMMGAGALALAGIGGTAAVPWIVSIGVMAMVSAWTAWYLLSTSRRAVVVVASGSGLGYSNRFTGFRPRFVPRERISQIAVSALNPNLGWSLNAVAAGEQVILIPSGSMAELEGAAGVLREALKLDSAGNAGGDTIP